MDSLGSRFGLGFGSPLYILRLLAQRPYYIKLLGYFDAKSFEGKGWGLGIGL